MRAYVYVDGLNLYYGALRNTPYKWLNLREMCRFLLPADRIEKINYFTAIVNARPHEPDAPTRQQIYESVVRQFGYALVLVLTQEDVTNARLTRQMDGSLIYIVLYRRLIVEYNPATIEYF